MILHRYIVNVPSRRINIRPVGDLQIGESGFREDLWKKWKRETIEDKTSLIIGMGDYTDRFRPTIDKKLRQVLVTDPSAHIEFDELIMKEIQGIAEEFKPFKGRIIGLHSGHHEHTFYSGVNSVQYLCQLLGVKYLGFVAMVQLILRRGKGSHSIDIFSTHGCGGASLINSDLAKLERTIMPYWDADVFLRGHSTKAYVVDGHPLNCLSSNRGNGELSIQRKKRVLVNTGGFMEGYVQGQTSYVEQANMPPCALGWCTVGIHMPDSKEEKLRINAYATTE